jgi:LAO/AO transport system kinase
MFLKRDVDWQAPVLTTEATSGKNIDLLCSELAEYVRVTKSNGQFEKHRHLQLRKKVLNIVKNRFQSEFLERLNTEMALDDVIEAILEGRTNPYEVGDELFEKYSRG